MFMYNFHFYLLSQNWCTLSLCRNAYYVSIQALILESVMTNKNPSIVKTCHKSTQPELSQSCPLFFHYSFNLYSSNKMLQAHLEYSCTNITNQNTHCWVSKSHTVRLWWTLLNSPGYAIIIYCQHLNPWQLDVQFITGSTYLCVHCFWKCKWLHASWYW